MTRKAFPVATLIVAGSSSRRESRSLFLRTPYLTTRISAIGPFAQRDSAQGESDSVG